MSRVGRLWAELGQLLHHDSVVGDGRFAQWLRDRQPVLGQENADKPVGPGAFQHGAMARGCGAVFSSGTVPRRRRSSAL